MVTGAHMKLDMIIKIKKAHTAIPEATRLRLKVFNLVVC